MSVRLVRRTTIFQGRVQGVGFRAAVESVSRNHRVAGWVRNESDGSVHCVSEGACSDLDAFIDAILIRMDGFVSSHVCKDSEGTGEYDAFRIQY